MPEEAYCSALDINSRCDAEPRFPWQCDAAIQCDLGMLPTITKPSITTTNTSNTTTTLVQPEEHRSSKHGLRFWKSSSILHHGSNANTDDNKKQQNVPHPKKRHHKSVLQRAVSFDSRGYSRLVHQNSSQDSSPTTAGGTHLYVPKHVQTLMPSIETPNISSHSDNKLSVAATDDQEFAPGANSAPNSRTGTPPSTPPHTFHHHSGTKIFTLNIHYNIINCL